MPSRHRANPRTPAAAAVPPADPSAPASGDDTDVFTAWCQQSLQTVGTWARAQRGDATGDDGFDQAAFDAAGLLTVHFADGSVLHTQPADWAGRYGAQLAPSRSAAQGSGDASRVVLPFDPVAGLGATRSGGGNLQVERFELVRLTPPTALDRLYDFGALFSDRLDRWFGQGASPGAGALAAKLCFAYENAVLDDLVRAGDASGQLLRWRDGGWAQATALGPEAPTSVVLLLHGTASSTQGSFKGLWRAEGDGGTAADWQQLLDGDGAGPPLVLAFEHRSLTASPLLNTLDLARQLLDLGLPRNIPLRLLSHSRGGLVGELLCLLLKSDGESAAQCEARDALTMEALERAYPAKHPDRVLLGELAKARDAVRARGWTAGIFVRTACPARGTLLADRRTDLFLSLLLRAVELGFGLTSPWYARLAGLVKGLVAARADARQLPGLEAMIPGAPLSVALNAMSPTVTHPGRLRVIAGDAQARGLAGLLTVLGDLYYGLHDHDFVVHTHAMFGGVTRADALSLRVEDPSVNHFGYFKPRSLTRQAVLGALDGQVAGFNALADDESRTRGLLQVLTHERSRRSWRQCHDRMEELKARGQGARPLLLVLPGIMGSELSLKSGDADHPVWLSLQAMLLGQLRRLRVTQVLEPTGVLSVAYERLLAAAEDQFHVFSLPFDWRQSIDALGQDAARCLTELLDAAAKLEPPQPVHVLAHSMGGLVARLALDPGGDGAELWRRFADADGRLLMLGTPNCGSYVPAQFLMQQHMVASVVALAGVSIDKRDLARMGARFPGLLAMLPHEQDPTFGDLFRADSWARAAAEDDTLVPPDPATLDQARAVREGLEKSFGRLKACERVLYVAGQGATPMHLRVASGWLGRSLRLGVTEEGDGTVPWTSCLDPVRTWYADGTHGNLADLPEAFDAYFELLRQGRTRRLSQVRPTARSVGDMDGALFPLPALPSLPRDAAAAVLGITERRAAGTAWVPPTAIRVVHGSLDYARHPLIVGHYANDGIYGAVQRVDQKLDGLLRRMSDLELVSGKAGTATYLRQQSRDGRPPPFPGAIVVGLGAVGELTPAALTDAVTRGVLRFAVEHLSQDTWAPREGPLLLQFSTLLVGTHVQALSKRDSLSAVLLGIWRAGLLLADGSALDGRPARVAEVEVIEIDEPVALDAAYALRGLLARPEWTSRYHWEHPVLESRDGGLSGYRPGGSDSIWQRLVVREDELGGLRYELIAERARVESTQVYADVASLRGYIDRVSDAGAQGGRRAAEEASTGRVLYQLLLPQALKSRLANFERTVLVVDERTAALPWELLTPPRRGATAEESAQPLAVQGGMVRQRLTPEFRATPEMPADWSALVIGEPATTDWTDAAGKALTFAALPGAAREAAQVAGQLRADPHPWQVELIEPGATFERVRTALLQQPWRMLHLAGHGVVNHWVRDVSVDGEKRRELRRTGMLLSHQQVLAAGDVEQMDPAPEFVFVNCCYSGRDAPGVVSGNRQQAMLAASLALQFIRMGSKAVVAAGWRVDDSDGLAFAEQLYAALLAGEPFGQAVLQARQKVHQKGRSNTWGAYQCYGDPDWRLIELDRGAGNAIDQRGSSRLRGADRCMSAAELATRIQQAVQVAGDKPTADLLHQLQGLETTLRADADRAPWLDDSRVASAFGGAYRELGRHDLAWHWYRSAALARESQLTMRQVELAARSLTRLEQTHRNAAGRLLESLDGLDKVVAHTEVQPARMGRGAARGRASTAGNASGTDADAVYRRARAGRATIRGSCLHRDAMALLQPTTGQPLAADAAARAARKLLEGADCYGASHSAARPDDAARGAYTLSNAVLLAGLALLAAPGLQTEWSAKDWVVELTPPAGTPCDGIDRRTDALLELLNRDDSGAEFWDYTNALGLRLARAVLHLAVKGSVDDADLDPLPQLLGNALVRWPSPVELQSLGFNFGSVRLLADGSAAVLPRDRLLAMVGRLEGAVREHRVGGGRVG
ncbi:MAG: CHAT domain-containing protein [Rubrivivax sp.]